MKKFFVLFFVLTFTFCGSSLDESFATDVINTHKKFFNDLATLSNEEVLDIVAERCNLHYVDLEELIISVGDWEGYYPEVVYNNFRNMGFDPYESEEILEAELNYCGFSSSYYVNFDTDIMLCIFEFDYQVYYLGNSNYDDSTIPCDS